MLIAPHTAPRRLRFPPSYDGPVPYATGRSVHHAGTRRKIHMVPRRGGDAAITARSPPPPQAARESLMRILTSAATGEAKAAQWIGHILGADRDLERMDTELYLRALSVAELREIATANNLKPAKQWPGLVAQLAGHLPNFQPAAFGAAGAADG